MVNVVELFLAQARARGGTIALVDELRGAVRATTFAELEDQSARIATLLSRRGVGPGSPVLLFHPPSAELYAVIIAIFRLGAIAMVIDLSAGRETLDVACRALPPSALFVSGRARLLALVSAPLRRIPFILTTGRIALGAARISEAAALPRHEPSAVVAADTPALVTFTSGSTGAAKGALRSHGVLRAQHEALGSVAARTGEVDLVSLPIVVLTNLGNGATSVIPAGDLRRPGAIEVAPVLEQIRGSRVARMTVSPVLAERLVDGSCANGVGHSPLEGVRIVTGGGPVFPDFIARAHAMTAATVVAVYGSTEAEPIAHVTSAEIGAAELEAMRGGAGLIAGRPVSETDVRIVPMRLDDAGRIEALSRRAPAREPSLRGEIIVSGAHVVPGYLHGRGDAETKVRAGGTVWHRTGDIGYLDDVGRLWLLGRAAATINDSRGELHPFAVECAARLILPGRRTVLAAHEGKRVLLVDDQLDPASRSTLAEGLSWAQLDRIIAGVKIPLDRRHNSKVDYAALGARLPRLVDSRS
ncbi:MAG: AMP-binding protein [Gemmatimonadaceae bacterium]